MERLCDEILQLVFYELPDPSPLTLVSRRLYAFSQDPYVRARYFLTHYGPTEAMYYALGRGKVLTERVVDILLSSGAHLSRYLVQIAMHHYFQTQAHFIRTPWVKNVSLGVFLHFMQKAQEKYGDIPRGKGEDDGSIFMTFLKESRFPSHMRSVTWENVLEILETYKFIPFSNKFPLILAIEPRLLPPAVANGFRMDYKYRDFVFRKMFERRPQASDNEADDIAHNVRELCKLDPIMFVTRTVAGEVCMEAKYNDVGYSALKKLDKSGHLRFELSRLVEDLLRTFLTTRAISHAATGDTLRQLYSDFPSSDPAVRLVVIIAVFISAESHQTTTQNIHSTLDALGVVPLTRNDVFNVLVNPFVEKYACLINYAKTEIVVKEDGSKGMDPPDIEALVEDVAVKCLEIGCKGKLLKKLFDNYQNSQNAVMRRVLERFQVRIEDVPSWEEDAEAAANYVAPLSRDFMRCGLGDGLSRETLYRGTEIGPSMGEGEGGRAGEERGRVEIEEHGSSSHEVNLFNVTEHEASSPQELGTISQESLTSMIRNDEFTPTRGRRRFLYGYPYLDASKVNYPHDALPIAKWARSQFGLKSSMAAIFLTHAVINDNTQCQYRAENVPVTLKHFKILARLGRMPVRLQTSRNLWYTDCRLQSYYLYHSIEEGAEFYLDEDDYVSKSDPAKRLVQKKVVKMESPKASLPPSRASSSRRTASPTSRPCKRPRRTATNVRSYAVPDSDDDTVMSGPLECKVTKETNMQLWIRHLGELLKVEQKKYREYKKVFDRSAEPGTKCSKTNFLKSLSSNLRALRKVEVETRVKYFGPEEAMEDRAEYDDDEFV
ncbi:hypothetical protein DFP72DRAFT_990005 [Ephemerocybe angulata]|uniref:Uncharacterized protein n=1 Tax=Ephemerocybe angulata TaxID=980116 RepID=A0A8H6M521_9AGAR|nr:hypothetical protein DFP72DRAFT_990005 [Tulosesus angulatus]